MNIFQKVLKKITEICAFQKTDLGIAIFNEPTLSEDVKAAVHFSHIFVGKRRSKVDLGIAFPKSVDRYRVEELQER